MTDTERLAEIRERCERAMQWNSLGTMRLATDGDMYSADQIGWNLLFAINARDDVPYLLAMVERLTAEVERIQSAFAESIERRDS